MYELKPWRRKWQPTPVFLPGKFHGQRRLAGYSLWGHKSWTQLSDFHFQKKEKKSLANSHIFGSEGQLLFDTVLIFGEDQIF